MPGRIIVALATAFSLISAPSAFADTAKYSCSPMKDGKRLQSLEVFDGPTQDNASLVPDSSDQRNGSWTLDYLYDQGGFATLRCKYSGGSVVDIEMKQKIKSCGSKTANKTFTVSCN